MNDPAGYREAAARIEAAGLDDRRRLAAQQAHRDHMVTAFDDIVQTAQPSSEELRDLLLMNLTTDPPYKQRSLALTWMQRLPTAWQGWYPEYCQRVAESLGIGEEVS